MARLSVFLFKGDLIEYYFIYYDINIFMNGFL